MVRSRRAAYPPTSWSVRRLVEVLTAGLPDALVFSARESQRRRGSGDPSLAGERADPLRLARLPISPPRVPRRPLSARSGLALVVASYVSEVLRDCWPARRGFPGSADARPSEPRKQPLMPLLLVEGCGAEAQENRLHDRCVIEERVGYRRWLDPRRHDQRRYSHAVAAERVGIVVRRRGGAT